MQASWQFNARQLPSQTAYSRAGVALSSRTLNYDANANLVSIADPVLRPNCFGSGNAACWTRPDADNTDGNRSFTYDALDRLTEVANPYVADQFTYDPLGNLRTSSELGSFTYDASNRVQSRIHGTVFTYTWDARGNLTSDGERSFSWNLANELVGDSHGTTYAYDARGWRVKEQASGESPVYSLYDRTHQLVTRWSAAQGETDFVRLAGTTVARVSGGQATWIHSDEQGSPLLETDASGSTTRQPIYLGYGRTDDDGRREIPGYTGAAMGQQNGTTYLGARYLYHDLFLSPDPAPLDPTTPFGLNRYAYANDNPVRFTDPDGRCPQCLWGMPIGAGVNLGVQLLTSEGSLSQRWSKVNWKQFGVAAVAGGLSGGVSAIAGTAATTGGTIFVNVVGNAGVGALATQVGAKVEGGLLL